MASGGSAQSLWCIDRILPDDRVEESSHGRSDSSPAALSGNAKQYGAALKSKCWPKDKKVIKVFFQMMPTDGDDIDARCLEVLKIANDWSKYCNIKFHETRVKERSDVRVEFIRSGSSWSYIGTDCNQEVLKEGTTMALADVGRPTVLHEFGHALGLIHEHQRLEEFDWDRDVVIDRFTREFGWTKQQIEENVFRRYSEGDLWNGTEYDRDSIMHYSFPKEFLKKKPDGPVPQNIPQNTELSEQDKKYIRTLYGGPEGEDAPDFPGSTKVSNTPQAAQQEKQLTALFEEISTWFWDINDVYCLAEDLMGYAVGQWIKGLKDDGGVQDPQVYARKVLDKWWKNPSGAKPSGYTLYTVLERRLPRAAEEFKERLLKLK